MMCGNGNSLAVQWLGLRTFTAEGVAGSIPGWGAKIPLAKPRGEGGNRVTIYLLHPLSSLFLPASPYFLLRTQKSGFSEKVKQGFVHNCVHRPEASKASFRSPLAVDQGRTFQHRETALQGVSGGMVWL